MQLYSSPHHIWCCGWFVDGPNYHVEKPKPGIDNMPGFVFSPLERRLLWIGGAVEKMWILPLMGIFCCYIGVHPWYTGCNGLPGG